MTLTDLISHYLTQELQVDDSVVKRHAENLLKIIGSELLRYGPIYQDPFGDFKNGMNAMNREWVEIIKRNFCLKEEPYESER